MRTTGIIHNIIDGISAIFMPLASLLSGAGILKGLLAVCTATSVLSQDSETYLVLHAMADSLFYFLPVLLAATAAKKFGANPFTSMVIGGILLYPSLTQALGSGATVHLFGIPLKGVPYPSSVIPILLAVGLLTFVERFLNRALPELLKGFLIPLLSIVGIGFVTLFAFGPVSVMVGDALAWGYQFVYGLSPMAAGLLLGALIQPMVIFGFQWSFLLIAMNNITATGHDTVLALIGPAVFAQAGAALAVMLKSKDKAFQSLCASAVLTALFGITQPAIFSVNLPRKTPMAAACLGAAAGGALAGLSGARAMSFAFPSLVSLPIFFGQGFALFLLSCLAAFATGLVLTLVMGFPADVPSESATAP